MHARNQFIINKVHFNQTFRVKKCIKKRFGHSMARPNRGHVCMLSVFSETNILNMKEGK